MTLLLYLVKTLKIQRMLTRMAQLLSAYGLLRLFVTNGMVLSPCVIP